MIDEQCKIRKGKTTVLAKSQMKESMDEYLDHLPPGVLCLNYIVLLDLLLQDAIACDDLH